MRKYIVLLCLVMAVPMVWAQFDPQIGQYMYMPTAYNPAAAGDGGLMKVAGLHRMQYVDIANAPMTTYFSVSLPFEIGNTKHGAGVRFMNDRYGLWTNQSLHLQYAYRHPLGKGVLSVGLDLGFLNLGFKGDSVNLGQMQGVAGQTWWQGEDDVVPKASTSGMGFDMGLGVFYSTGTWWVGISYSHLTQPKIRWMKGAEGGDEIIVRPRGTMVVSGGYDFLLRHHKDWKLCPSAIVMTDFASWDVSMTLMCQYRERYRWGLGYSIASSVNILVNVDIISGLTLGYGLALPTNKLITESYGSHEIYLAYGFDILRPKRNHKYKSVRYL